MPTVPLGSWEEDFELCAVKHAPEPVHTSTTTHRCKYYAKHRVANLPFSYEYFHLHLHSQWFEATFNSLLFSTFMRTEHRITEKIH